MFIGIINSEHIPQRYPILLKELESQNITQYQLFPSIHLPSVVESINKAHKQIIEYAKVAGFEEVCIFEDDIHFTSPNSWKCFLENKPKDYDIYLGGIYLGDIKEDNTIDKFTGFHCYIVHSRFYDTFLNTDNLEHIDIALSNKGKYVVCNPFIAIQHNGFSSNTGQNMNYDFLIENRRLLI